MYISIIHVFPIQFVASFLALSNNKIQSQCVPICHLSDAKRPRRHDVRLAGGAFQHNLSENNVNILQMYELTYFLRHFFFLCEQMCTTLYLLRITIVIYLQTTLTSSLHLYYRFYSFTYIYNKIQNYQNNILQLDRCSREGSNSDIIEQN